MNALEVKQDQGKTIGLIISKGYLIPLFFVTTNVPSSFQSTR